MKYPIGIQDFERIIEDGYVYLDKTGLVYDLFETLYSDRIFHIAAFLIKYGAKIQFYFHISLVYLSLFCMKDSKEKETCTKLW